MGLGTLMMTSYLLFAFAVTMTQNTICYCQTTIPSYPWSSTRLYNSVDIQRGMKMMQDFSV
ncbi:hypothetical protein HOLleu_35591 [Holothuria leucospilota]|uniref:Uncharacterized protein n=1 Tax=Holothuria leucospilota TaxID=206669 RepID=A0A9Q0YQ65_HOLLE|nr:hypothetical protein HOLleu_35591 [Holothuria leucospilota]